MTFNRRDLQDDDDDFKFDDDFSFGDDQKSGDDFKFDDEPADIGLDDDKDKGFGFEDEDMPVIDDGGTIERQGPNRTFVILAGLMILLFVAGLAVVLFLALRQTGPTPVEQTRSAIETQNADTLILLGQTQTAAVVVALAQTQTASVPTATPTETPTPRPPTITPTPVEPTLDATQQFANALLTQTAREATQTAEAALIEPTREPQDANAVALTATRLAEILLGAGGGQATEVAGLPTPTREGGGAAAPTQLPDTGIFDDIGSGGNAGLIALLALGLVGVIVLSRVARAANK